MNIRPEVPDDAAAIEALTVAAFLHAPHTDHCEQHIVRALRQAGALSVSLVAADERGIVGHVAISPVTIVDGTPGWYGLGPLSVLPAHQRQGLGTRLVQHALAALQARGAAGCVVLGDPAYYSRFGFRAKPTLVLAEVPPQYFQALAFTRRPLPAGTVRYHEAFAAKA